MRFQRIVQPEIDFGPLNQEREARGAAHHFAARIGYVARHKLVSIDKNPYQLRASSFRASWLDGWLLADSVLSARSLPAGADSSQESLQ